MITARTVYHNHAGMFSDAGHLVGLQWIREQDARVAAAAIKAYIDATRATALRASC